MKNVDLEGGARERGEERKGRSKGKGGEGRWKVRWLRETTVQGGVQSETGDGVKEVIRKVRARLSGEEKKVMGREIRSEGRSEGKRGHEGREGTKME